MNQFGDSSSALFTKNKTCLNVFVGPGDGGLYPQFNGQRYLKMSDTDIWANTDSLGGSGKFQLNQWYASHLGFVLREAWTDPIYLKRSFISKLLEGKSWFSRNKVQWKEHIWERFISSRFWEMTFKRHEGPRHCVLLTKKLTLVNI